MSYFLKPAVKKVRNITRVWMTRVMLCYKYKDFFNISIILVISLIILFLTYRISLKISNGERHEDIEVMAFLLIISIYCIIETGKSLIRARKSEKKLNDELRRIMDLEHSINIGKLSKGIIHDLMTPISAITLYIEEINNHPENLEKSKVLIDKAVLATKRISNFMDCVRYSINSCAPTYSSDAKTNLHKEINKVRDIISYKARISETKLNIDIPENITLQAHSMRVHQILINILNNALESKAKNIDVSVKKSEGFATIFIQDDGCGISNTQLKDLFTKPGTTKKYGAGIGLTCVYSIVKDELHGDIQVFSKEGCGTTFTLRIPLAP